MTWFAASVLFAFDNLKGPQRRWYVWEDVVLIEASSRKEVMAKARAYGKATTRSDDALNMGGHLATMRFVGVRKVLTISNPTHMDIDQSDHPPVDGTEITFTEFLVESRGDLKKLIDGKEVSVIYAGENRGQLRLAEGRARSARVPAKRKVRRSRPPGLRSA
jgi:hypothetical protein